MVHCLPPWLSDSIGSQAPFATGSPLGSSQFWLAFGSASSPVFFFFFGGGGGLVFLLCFGAVVSRFSAGILYLLLILLFERALFLVEPSDS